MEIAKELQNCELVTMSQVEYDKLKVKLGNDILQALEHFENCCLANGYVYKSYYRAMLVWGIDAWREKQARRQEDRRQYQERKIFTATNLEPMKKIMRAIK